MTFNLCSSRGEEDYEEDEKKKKNPTTEKDNIQKTVKVNQTLQLQILTTTPNGKTQYTKDCEGEPNITTTNTDNNTKRKNTIYKRL